MTRSGCAVAPAGQGGGPLARAAQLVDLVAPLDDAAVDEARDQGRHLAGDDGDHRLVQQGEPFVDAVQLQEGPPLQVATVGGQVQLTVARADLGRPDGRGAGRLVVTGGELLQHERQQQIPVLDALAPDPLERPPRSGEPPGRPPRLTEGDEPEAQPEGAPRGAHRVPGLEVGAMRPLQGTQAGVVEGPQIRRSRQQLEVLGPERRPLVGERERAVGVRPRPAAVRLAAALELLLPLHDTKYPPDAGAAAPHGKRRNHLMFAGLRARRREWTGSAPASRRTVTAGPCLVSPDARRHARVRRRAGGLHHADGRGA